MPATRSQADAVVGGAEPEVADLLEDAAAELSTESATQGHAIGHVGRGGIVSSRDIRIEDSNIRTETELLAERLDCVDRAPIRWGWRRGLREQREAGEACGTLFFSHPPTPSRVFVFVIVGTM